MGHCHQSSLGSTSLPQHRQPCVCPSCQAALSAPATAAPLQAGAFKIGDTAGTIDNITTCKLHRPGSVGFVSKSGGMSNEMYNVLARATDGLYEGEGCCAGTDAAADTAVRAAVLHSYLAPAAADRRCQNCSSCVLMCVRACL
jgi:hypothetical protein